MPVAPSNIVFDVGNVLIEWDPRNLYRRIFDDPARMEWFLANVFTLLVAELLFLLVPCQRF